jgi:hypothetical protein
MLRKLLSSLTYANVIATTALFLVLAGAGAIAATNICPPSTPCVNSDDIIDGEVKTSDLGTAAVTNVKLANNSVRTGKVVDNNLLGADLLDGTVATNDLANGAVTPAKVGTIPGARAQKTSDQTVSHNTDTTLTFDTESFDTASLHDNATNNSRLTAPISGVYEVDAGIVWGPSVSGDRVLSIRSSVLSFVASSKTRGGVTAGDVTQQSTSGLVKLPAGGTVEAHAYQNSGASLPARGGGGFPDTFLAMHWVGPG